MGYGIIVVNLNLHIPYYGNSSVYRVDQVGELHRLVFPLCVVSDHRFLFPFLPFSVNINETQLYGTWNTQTVKSVYQADTLPT